MKKCFVDTNVLAYAKDSRFPQKQTRAQKWISALTAQDRIVLSAQSLREHYSVSLRLDRSPSAVRAARLEVAGLRFHVPDALREDRLDEAWALQDRYGLGFWDALLVASALAVGCELFLSEDLHAGQQISGLRIVDPFATTPEDALL